VTIKIVTSFGHLMRLARAEAEARESDDPGAWVRAWVWCPDADVQAWLETEQARAAAS